MATVGDLVEDEGPQIEMILADWLRGLLCEEVAKRGTD